MRNQLKTVAVTTASAVTWCQPERWNTENGVWYWRTLVIHEM